MASLIITAWFLSCQFEGNARYYADADGHLGHLYFTFLIQKQWWMKFSVGRNGKSWCWNRTRIFSLTLSRTTSMGRDLPLGTRRLGSSGEHPWSLILTLDPEASSCNRLIWILKVQNQLRVNPTAGGVWEACIHWGKQSAGKVTNKVKSFAHYIVLSPKVLRREGFDRINFLIL